ncbi:MAG: AzlC family ABC transporter permease [Spirochaetia bacterium]|nr:AzlC family ABC transporter permease [Spirochaetia bacterium]
MNELKKGLRDGIPICLGYFSVAFAFGIFCVNSGLSPLQATLISLTNVTSAGQLAAVPIMTNAGTFVELALAQLVINLRYALMSISISQKLDSSMTTPHRLVISFANTDEIFAVASGRESLVGKHYMYGLILTPIAGWTIGTLVGAVAGNILPAAMSDALGIAIYGMFIAIIIPVAKKNFTVLKVILTAVLLSCMFAFVPGLNKVSSGFVIIICAVVSAALFAAIAPVEE